MNNFEKALVSYIGEARLIKLQNVKVGIAGAGGIGSNVAFNLVRSGFKNFIIVDFDKIEYSNLNRQFYFSHQVGRTKVEVLKENLLAINPDVQIKALNLKVDESNVGDIFSDCHVIVEAFDKVAAKKMLMEAYLNSRKLLLAVSGIAGWGKSDEVKINKIKENFFIVGDQESAVSLDLPPISPRVNIAAAKIADVILDTYA